MATSVTAQWWHDGDEVAWADSFDAALATMSDTFAGHHSLALQQTMFEMGAQMIASQPGSARCASHCRTSTTSCVDLSPFGLDNPNEVFHADDRPYGLIEGTIRRDDAAGGPGPAFDPGLGW
jgi:urate oxidase